MKMTKKERFKKFTKDNADLIAASAYFAGAAGIVVGILYAFKSVDSELKQNVLDRNTWAEGENLWIQEQVDEGKAVYLLHDNSYLTIPDDTETEWIADRPKQP